MTDPVEKSSDDGSGTTQPEIFERPKGFRGCFSHPATQARNLLLLFVALLGFVCFMCPGLYNSLTGLGGGGQVDETTGANANVALYSTFSVSVNNKLGPRLTLQLGSLGYGLYIAGFLVLNIHPHAKAFVIVAGATVPFHSIRIILGLCAGLLWTAQGSLMLAYPTEGDKAKFIAIFWAIFNLGGVVGAAVAFGTNFHTTNGTYIAFLILTIIGACIPLLMANPRNVIRTDGSKLPIMRNPSWKVELMGLYVALKTDPMIVLLFPMFFASNWFYIWQFNEFNGALFNIRTRSLNSMLYWSAQIVGSVLMAVVLDRKNVSRRTRAYAGWFIVFVMVFVVHGWAYHYQREYTRASPIVIDQTLRIDFTDKRYVGRVFLYIFFGLLDAMWQTLVYWMMGAMSNDPRKLAYFAGFCGFMNMFASTWALCAAGLIFALPMIHLRVKDITALEDETVARMDEDGHVLPTDVAAAKIAEKTRA
ncbi:MFS general substrate transporter [Mycena pura]|uniref:MFS general substrate transporter n=1 Tax=Mycena pura TaxID=153505 RepID=A0AAD6VC18_9AGAR|nr:MFS general substrate transporter [Mycena pura]